MSLGAGAAAFCYRPAAMPTSDPFQFAVAGHCRSAPDGVRFDVKQSRVMYDDCRRGARGFATSPFSAAAAFDSSAPVRDYDYVPGSSYPMPSGQPVPGYGTKTPGLTPGGLAVPYGQGLDRVHGQSTPINHGATSPQTCLQPGFAIYPWMRSMTTGMATAHCVYVSVD